MKQLVSIIFFVFLSTVFAVGQTRSLNLSGQWKFQIDREDAGVKQRWFNKQLDDCINLPGSMPEKPPGD